MYITLATLPHVSQQQVYDHVHNHLMTQGQRSLGPEVQGFKGCVYRTPSGLKCAAGSCIAYHEYGPEFEGKTWPNLVN